MEFSLVCSNSLNMNYTDFSFIGLVKLNIERHFLGMNPSFLSFLKHMRLDSSEGQAITIICYPLWTCKNEKRHSSIMMGKLREGKYISFSIITVISHLWTWYLSTFNSVNWVFSLSLSRSTFMIHDNPLSHVHCHIVFCLVKSMPKSSVVPPDVQREVMLRFYTYS